MKERGVVCEDDVVGRGENCIIGVVYIYYEKDIVVSVIRFRIFD